MLIARFIIRTTAPLHIGGGESMLFDQPVSRDPFGFWNIQGTSLAGVLRSALDSEDPEAAESLFGSMKNGDDDGGSASKIWFSDAVMLDVDGRDPVSKVLSNEAVEMPLGPFIRDHVRIGIDGVAEDGAKYDEEIVPRGVSFAFEMSLDAKAVSNTDRQNFLRLAGIVRRGGLRFGGKTVNGYGSFDSAYAECREFNLASEKGLEAWLNLSNGTKFIEGEGESIALEAGELRKPRSGQDVVDARIAFRLINATPVLLGGANPDDLEYDMCCLKTPVIGQVSGAAPGSSPIVYRYTLPGSSLRGVIRHRVRQIAQALSDGAEGTEPMPIDPDDETNNIFGAIGKDDGSDTGSMGRVFCSDACLEDAKAEGIQHVSIDRLSGGAVKGALFSEAPVISFTAPFTIEAKGLTLLQAKLLAHALLDLFTGDLAVGGGASRGNGRVLLEGVGSDGSGLKEALSRIECEVWLDGEKVDLSDPDEREMLLEMLDEARGE